MAISMSQGFKYTAPVSADNRIVLSKAEMKAIIPGTDAWAIQPAKYYCVCTDDNQLYVFNSNATFSSETGYFALCAAGELAKKQDKLGINPTVTTTSPQLTSLTIDGTDYQLNGITSYIKSAAVADNTLTLTKEDDTTIEFTNLYKVTASNVTATTNGYTFDINRTIANLETAWDAKQIITLDIEMGGVKYQGFINSRKDSDFGGRIFVDSNAVTDDYNYNIHIAELSGVMSCTAIKIDYSKVTASATGTSTSTEVSYLTIDGTEYKLSTISPNNAYTNIKQIADYLFEVQYTTENTDYDWANNYFSSASTEELEAMYASCTAVVKDNQVLRQFDYYYNQNEEFIVRRCEDPENHTFASIGMAAGVAGLTKPVVESGAYNVKYKLVPFSVCDGVNSTGLYVQQNVVPGNGITYDINPSQTRKVCVTMLLRYLLDYCTGIDDIEDKLQSVNIYSTDKFTFGFHFMVAQYDETTQTTTWKVIELSANSYTIVTEGTGTNQMPHGILTNFRTTGLTFVGDEVQPSSIETFGIGLERYKIASQAFASTGAKTLDELRTELKYSHLYTDAISASSWRTELCGDKQEGVTPVHKLTVMDSIDNPSFFNANLATEATNWVNKTRLDGKDCWHTVHSSIYDLTDLTFKVAIQERFGEIFEFALNETSGSSDGTMGRTFVTGCAVGFLPSGTQINSSDLIKDVLYKILYDSSETIGLYMGSLTTVPPTSLSGLTKSDVSIASLKAGTYTTTIVSGDDTVTPPVGQHPTVAIPFINATTPKYTLDSIWPTSFPYPMDFEYADVQDSSGNYYRIYYLPDFVYDKDNTPPGTSFGLKVVETT